MGTETAVDIIDYDAGNLHSIANAMRAVGADVRMVRSPDQLRGVRLILPGVGAFGAAMASLQAAGFDAAIHRHVQGGRPFLGICVGFQLLFETGTELGSFTGLGCFAGSVDRFETQLHVPHVGWNTIRFVRPHPLFAGLQDDAHVYFVHSYRPVGVDPADVLCDTEYDGRFVSGVARANIAGLQFHPEKSGANGLQMLKNFLSWTP